MSSLWIRFLRKQLWVRLLFTILRDYVVRRIDVLVRRPEINNVARLRARSHFGAYMLAGNDDHTANPPRWTLKSLMRLNGTFPLPSPLPNLMNHSSAGHKFISILKIDIEGGEFEVLTDLIKSYKESGEPLPFGQLQIEIHALNKSVEWMIEWWEMLEEAGLRAFWTEPNLVRSVSLCAWLRRSLMMSTGLCQYL